MARPGHPTESGVALLQNLLPVLGVMPARLDEIDVLAVVASTIASLSRCRVVGVWRSDAGWWALESGSSASPNAPLAILEWVEAGGTGEPPGGAPTWARAFELLGLDGPLGAMLVDAGTPPTEGEQALLRVFAYLTGVVLSRARGPAGTDATATEFGETKARLAATAEALERSTAIHTRLTEVVVGGGGEQAVAEAVHALTSLPVAVEDEFGRLRAWAGGEPPDPYPNESRAGISALIERAERSGKAFRDGGRLVALANPRGGGRGLLALIDPKGIAGPGDEIALERGATVLAMVLACLRAVTETEQRLGRDLVEDLLAGADEETIFRRAGARGVDLHRPHRAVVVAAGSHDPDGLFDAVRRSAMVHGLGTIVATLGTTVVVVSGVDCDWEAFHVSIEADLPYVEVAVGVGGVCRRPAQFARSHHEATLALRTQTAARARRGAVRFEDLGVYGLLADVADPHEVERFARRWLGALLTYDRARGTDLVSTLDTYLRCGGSYDATAKTLHVHRNTVKYRLHRVRDVSGHDLSDAETKFNLQLATRAWGTLVALRTSVRETRRHRGH
jgi:sugar diacid utilization regulator